MFWRYFWEFAKNNERLVENFDEIIRILWEKLKKHLILCRYSYFEKILHNVWKSLLTLWEYFEENWKNFCLPCFEKILKHYKKYFEEIFESLEKMIEE